MIHEALEIVVKQPPFRTDPLPDDPRRFLQRLERLRGVQLGKGQVGVKRPHGRDKLACCIVRLCAKRGNGASIQLVWTRRRPARVVPTNRVGFEVEDGLGRPRVARGVGYPPGVLQAVPSEDAKVEFCIVVCRGVAIAEVSAKGDDSRLARSPVVLRQNLIAQPATNDTPARFDTLTSAGTIATHHVAEPVVDRAKHTDHLQQPLDRLDHAGRLGIDARVDMRQPLTVKEEN